MAEIEKNEFNLNISRYISTAEDEAQIDLQQTHVQLLALTTQVNAAKKAHNNFLRELGLPELP